MKNYSLLLCYTILYFYRVRRNNSAIEVNKTHHSKQYKTIPINIYNAILCDTKDDLYCEVSRPNNSDFCKSFLSDQAIGILQSVNHLTVCQLRVLFTAVSKRRI